MANLLHGNPIGDPNGNPTSESMARALEWSGMAYEEGLRSTEVGIHPPVREGWFVRLRGLVTP